MSLSLIVAMDANGLIGDRDKLPWHLPEDLKYFKDTTKNHIVVMGRNTFESIGKPLVDRISVVLSRTVTEQDDNPFVMHVDAIYKVLALDNILKDSEIFIIGGAEIYKRFYQYCDKLYITRINGEYEGNIYFPYPNKRIEMDFELESATQFTHGSFNIMKRRS